MGRIPTEALQKKKIVPCDERAWPKETYFAKEERDRFHSSLYRPPTVDDELNELRETEDLYENTIPVSQCLVAGATTGGMIR